MNKNYPQFFEIFTDFQCYILANINKGNINGVTATHYNIIDFICRKNEVTGKQIASAFNVSQAAISKQLKFLLENELIEQKQQRSDRRVFNLYPTEKGKFIIENSESFRQNFAKQAASILTQDEFAQFAELMRKILEKVK